MSAERDDSVRAAADAVSAGKATKETVDALLAARIPRPIRPSNAGPPRPRTASPSWRA